MKRALFLLAGLVIVGQQLPAWAGDKDTLKPVNVEKVNTAGDEVDPFAGPDNLTLYYAARTSGTFGIYVSRRGNANQAWPAGKRFQVSKEADQRSPFVHKGVFYFATNEVPDPELAKEKNFDIVQKRGMQAPLPLLGVSEKTDERDPWITPAGKEFYFSRKTEDGWKLFMAAGPTPGPIGKARAVGFPEGFHHATLTKNALSMYLQGPLENDRWGLFHSKRSRVGAEWSKPEPLSAVNHAEGKRGDVSPSLSPDGARLYFASDRPGGKGGFDIWYVPTSHLK